MNHESHAGDSISRGCALSAAAVFAAFMLSQAHARETAIEPVATGTAHQAMYSIAIDGQRGIAVGAFGAVSSSSDGGATWTAEQPPTELALLGVDLHGERGIAVGQSGLTLTREGSGNWLQADTGTQQRLFGVSMNSGGLAIAVGSFGTIIRSEDFGRHWLPVVLDWASYTGGSDLGAGMDPHLYAVHVDALGVATAVGEFGLVLRSEDAGKRWEAVSRGEASLFAIHVRDDGVAYAVGQSGTILRSTDDCRHWVSVASGLDQVLLGIASTAAGLVVAPGMHGIALSRDGGGSWTLVKAGGWYAGTEPSADGSAILLAGQAGRILKYQTSHD